MSFYSNFNKNISLGGQDQKNKEHGSRDGDDDLQSRRGFLEGFTAARSESDQENPTASGEKMSFLDEHEASTSTIDKPNQKDDEMGITTTKSFRQLREAKIAKARLRYYQRRGITEQEALQERY
ncbi:MAG UNVERIFIED_CONTAM: hypothetical protein LVR18_36330 [Planctomycetaceae bacterium]